MIVKGKWERKVSIQTGYGEMREENKTEQPKSSNIKKCGSNSTRNRLFSRQHYRYKV